MKLTARDFYYANDVGFLNRNPDVMERLIESTRERTPDDCMECIFFKWRFGDDGKIAGGSCAVDPGIGVEKFRYGNTAEGCPLGREGEGNETQRADSEPD